MEGAVVGGVGLLVFMPLVGCFDFSLKEGLPSQGSNFLPR